jgi:phosphoribosylamine--glycine ligase
MTERAFGAAGDEVVIEDFLNGEEASFHALVDGIRAVALISAQDHKAAHDGDEGPNTGGMGAYSPAPVVTPEMASAIMERIITPTIEGMAAEGRPFKGVLYAGLMISGGEPSVIEYNVRFGDPECQPLMMLLKSDMLDVLEACADGRLDTTPLDWHDGAALVVVMAANGYPGRYQKGSEIRGLEEAESLDGVTVFHAGTKAGDGTIVANGGRVLGIGARAPTVAKAQKKAYQAVDRIDWPEGFCRRDIGWRAV